MIPITIEMEERHHSELVAAASDLGVSVEVYARNTLLRPLGYVESRRNVMYQEAFEKALQYTLEKNDELFRRLAQH